MRNPEKTDFNKDYFRTCNGGKPMSLKDFKKHWRELEYIGNPENYYTQITGVKLTKKTTDESDNS